MLHHGEPSINVIYSYVKIVLDQMEKLNANKLSFVSSISKEKIELRFILICACMKGSTSTAQLDFQQLRAVEFRKLQNLIHKIFEYLKKRLLRGVEGPCVLSIAPEFNIIWGIPFDVMHTEYLGVSKF